MANKQYPNQGAVTSVNGLTGDVTVSSGGSLYAADTGSANALAVTLSGTPAIVAGLTISVLVANNVTGAATIDVDSTGAVAINKNGSAALANGDIVAGQIITIEFDGTYWQMQSPAIFSTAAFEQTANKDAASGYAGLDSNALLKLAEQCTSVNSQGGTSYTVLDTDRAKSVLFTNGSAVAVTLPQAGAASQFKAGWFAEFLNNPASGTGAVTITPTTSTINGAASIVLLIGNSVLIVSDGANYWAFGIFAVGTPSDGYIPVYVAASGNVQWLSPSVAGGSNAVQLRGKNIASAVGSAGASNDGQVLTWVNANSDFELKSPIPQSESIAITTGSIAPGVTATGTVAIALAAELLSVLFSTACRVQLYANAASQTADALRGPVPPTPGTPHGVLFDGYFTGVSPYTSPFTCSPTAALTNVGGQLAITAASQSGSNTTYTYTLTSGAAVATGQRVVVTGMAHSGNNGVFYITGTGAGTFTVVNASGSTQTENGTALTQSTSIWYTITNLSASTVAITVTFYFVPQEN